MNKCRPGLCKRMVFAGIARLYLKKPEQAEFLLTRYVSYSSIGREGLNQLLYMLHATHSFAVTSLQIEPTNRCNLRCAMCPVNRNMARKKGDMDFNRFCELVDRNPEVEYYLLMNWGEPLLHPRIFDMIRYIRAKGGRPLLTTNGTLLTKDTMEEMIQSGLERVTISLDGAGKTYERIRGTDYAMAEKRIEDLISMRNNLHSDMAVDINMVVSSGTEGEVNAFVRKWQGRVNRVQIQPEILFSGKRQNRCKEPWRGNLIVLWDGTVVPCCVDFDAELPLGNAFQHSLREVFNMEASRSLRQAHNEQRFPGPCAACNEYETPFVRPRFD